MMLLRALVLLFLTAVPCAAAEICTAENISSPQDRALVAFAQRAHLAYPQAFRRIADHLHADGGAALPPCYLTKRAAEARGWRPGGDLWRVVPGGAIGGDRFDNREGRLPHQWNGRFAEADLDYAGGHRGADRLIYVRGMGERWLLFVTTDHDRSFVAFVPDR
jgi:hypothetical protein